MDYIPFNSRNTLHKSHFGAVREGQNFVFKVVLPRSISCSGVNLVIKKDGEDYKYIPFSWLSMKGDSEEWWAILSSCSALFFIAFKLVFLLFASTTASSSKLFHAIQSGHFPSHFTLVYPHSRQTYAILELFISQILSIL